MMMEISKLGKVIFGENEGRRWWGSKVRFGEGDEKLYLLGYDTKIYAIQIDNWRK